MAMKWIGALLIMLGCGGCGITIAMACRQEEIMLQQLIHVLQFMHAELEYRLTPLSELCSMAAEEATGTLRCVFLGISQELVQQYQPDAGSCMSAVLRERTELSPRIRRHLYQLGRSLGRFDLVGQLSGLKSIQTACEEDLRKINLNSEVRHRTYRTLGICAGTALVILFA